MANYVKFRRGSSEAFKLIDKNALQMDTLYFIYDEDQSSAELYLGSKLISGGNSGIPVSGEAFLKNLKDVLIEANLSDNSLLVYDKQANKWINKQIDELCFIGATDLSDGISGFVPTPKAGESDLFLKGDGTWGVPNTDHFILTLENTNEIDHNLLIKDAVDKSASLSGDIIIVKDPIGSNKWNYTAYVFDDGAWHAMDGNYNAENVYFDEDLITTTAIGNIELVNGQATIAAAGKNLKEVFETIFVEEKEPTATAPSITVTLVNAGAYEVGTEIDTAYSARLKAGTYTYGPATGITATSWQISNGSDIKDTATGTFGTIIIGDNTDFKVTATATYNDGAIPVTNLGKPYENAQIKADSVTKISNAITGYRKSFYGCREAKDDLTSDLIRKLHSTEKALAPKSQVTVNVAIGSVSIILAYPANLPDLVSVTDTNAMGSEILSSFTKEIIKVNGANSHEPCDYKVYTIKFANPYDTSNYYTFTIGEEAET